MDVLKMVSMKLTSAKCFKHLLTDEVLPDNNKMDKEEIIEAKSSPCSSDENSKSYEDALWFDL